MVISSIDIGTNTVLLLTAEIDLKNNKILPLLNEYRIPRIGKNLGRSGVISDDSVEKLKSILIEYKEISARYNSSVILASATAAFRKASNSNHIINMIREQTSIEIKIIPGDEEALLAYLGVTSDYPGDELKAILDIGGGSTEIIFGHKDKILFRRSFNAGVVSSSELFSSSKSFVSDLKDYFQSVFTDLKNESRTISSAFAIAGTPTAISAIKLGLDEFEPDKVEGSILTMNDIESFIFSYVRNSEDYISKYKNVLAGREDLIIPGALILLRVMEDLDIERYIVSTRGIRHGAIIKYLNDQGWVF